MEIPTGDETQTRVVSLNISCGNTLYPIAPLVLHPGDKLIVGVVTSTISFDLEDIPISEFDV